MTITDDMLRLERPQGLGTGGVQRMYDLPNGYSLSCVNAPILHSFPFAWEIAVINPQQELDYDTPLTSDVEVFQSDDEANEFIAKAKAWALEIMNA